MSVSAAELRAGLQINVEKLATEAAQRDNVVRSLAALGYRKAPQVLSGKLEGSTIRLYVFKDSPAGDLILAAGPGFIPKILAASDITTERPGVYILADTDRTRAASRAAATGERWKPKADKLPRVARERMAKTVERVAERIEHAPRTSGKSLAAAERDELKNALAALLG
jgi:hypothetical protein